MKRQISIKDRMMYRNQEKSLLLLQSIYYLPWSSTYDLYIHLIALFIQIISIS